MEATSTGDGDMYLRGRRYLASYLNSPPPPPPLILQSCVRSWGIHPQPGNSGGAEILRVGMGGADMEWGGGGGGVHGKCCTSSPSHEAPGTI